MRYEKQGDLQIVFLWLQAAMMHDLEVSRDKAIEKLKESRGRVKHNSKFSSPIKMDI